MEAKMFDYYQTFNLSAKKGLFWCACVAGIVFLLLHWWWGYPNWFVGLLKVLIAFGVGIVVFVLGTHDTPVGHIAVLKVFGKRRRWGPGGRGLPEGLNWTPFLRIFNFGSYVDIDMRERMTRISPTDRPPEGMPAGVLEYTKGDQRTLVGLNTSLFWSPRDAYDWLSHPNPEGALTEVAVQVLRDEVMDHNNTDIIEHDKSELSDKLKVRIDRVLAENRSRADRATIITDLLVFVRQFLVRGTALPAKQNAAIVDAAAAMSRRESELRDAETLQQGADKLMKDTNGNPNGVDGRSALAAVLVGLDRQGARFHHISIPDDVADAVRSVGKSVGEVASKVADVVGDKKGTAK
jgi:hypothetical protein